MPFEGADRLAILEARAAQYVEVSLENIVREYPVMPIFIASGPGPYPSHRALHPAFFGCFDWHSCVELHLVIVRLLRMFPDLGIAARARAQLSELLTPENIAAEIAFFSDPNHRSIERPYGWGWLLALAHDLETWDDPDGQRWAAAVRPLADLLSTNMAAWLPKMTYPQRSGVHSNSAFALTCALPEATRRAGGGDDALLGAITTAATRWFVEDTDYPAHYEPSGADFLSAGLCEAALMSRLLPGDAFETWLSRFLPGLADGRPAAIFTPAIVSDSSDGQMAHLHGLNLSRAWAFVVLADALPGGDSRREPLLRAAERHADAALPHVAGSHYMVEHWLAVYAMWLLSA